MTDFKTEFVADFVLPPQPQESHGQPPQPRPGYSPVWEYPASMVEWTTGQPHPEPQRQDDTSQEALL